MEGRTIISSWPELEMTCACSKDEDQHCVYELELSMFAITMPLKQRSSLETLHLCAFKGDETRINIPWLQGEGDLGGCDW